MAKQYFNEANQKALTAANVFGSGYSDYVDQYRRQPNPSVTNLLHAYASTVYACVDRNANTCAKTKLRLYTKVRTGKKSLYRTKSLGKFQRDHLRQKITYASGLTIDEVIEGHPFQDLQCEPNPYQNWFQFLNLTQRYLETVGVSYWYPETNGLNVPDSLWLFQPQFMKVKRDNEGYPTGYSYLGTDYDVDEIIVFSFADLLDPYSGGKSPLRAVWEMLNIEQKFDASLASVLDNEGFPSIIVSFPEGGPGEAETERMERRWSGKLRRGGKGGTVFVDETIKVDAFPFPAKDLSTLQIKELTKVEICNCFGVPPGLLDTDSLTHANLVASLEMHAEQAILPRLENLQAVLNRFLWRFYDPTKTLFLAFDDPTPDQKEELQAELTGYVGGPILTANEARLELGYPPQDGGDVLAGNVNYVAESGPTQNDSATANPAADPSAAPIEATPQEIQTLPSSTLNGAQIASATAIVQQVALGQLPRDSGLGQLQILLNLTAEQAGVIMGSVGRTFFAPQANDQPQQPRNDPPPDEEQEAKSKAWKAHYDRVPKGKELVPILRRAFARQREHYLGEIQKRVDELATKGLDVKTLPREFVPLDKWDDELAKEVQPVIEIYFAKGGRELIQRVGASPDVFNVTNPKLKEEVKKLSLTFAKSTNRTTTKELNVALDELRGSLEEGLTAGDRMRELRQRVEKVFDNAERYRAGRVAQSEASRAHHEALREAAKASGVVRGFKLLLSSEACPVCRAVFEQSPTIGLDDKGFATIGGNEEYADSLLPIHPNCECTVTEVLDIQA